MLIKRLSGVALGAAAAIGVGLAVLPAQAQYIVTFREVGGDVVATGSGSIDLAGLSLTATQSVMSQIAPQIAVILTGPTLADSDFYTGIAGNLHPFTGPSDFGGAGGTFATFASSGAGSLVGIQNNSAAFANLLFVPAGYVSGAPLSDTMTFDDATFESLGVIPGVYTWTWTPPPGLPAAPDGSFTLDVVPEPATWIMMLAGFVGLGLVAWRQGRAIKSTA